MEWQWIAARASGFTAYGLVTLATVFGLLLSQRWQSRSNWPRLLNDQLHQYLVVLAGVFTAIHGLSVWIDPFTKFTWLEVVVPGASHYRPLWMALGIIASYLGLAIVISGWLRPKIGYPWWRRLHYLTFAVWLLATLHGLGDGSDTRATWAIAIYGVSSAAVVGLTMSRLLRPAAPRGRTFVGWAALAGFVAAAGLLFALGGPMRPGWNKIANGGSGSGSRLAAMPAVATALQSAYTAPFQGSASEQGPDGQGIVTLRFNLQVQGGPYSALTLILQGTSIPGGGLQVTGSTVALGNRAQPGLYQGTLTALNGGAFAAALSSGSGLPPLTIGGQLRLEGGSGVVGTLEVAPGGAGGSLPQSGSDDGGGF